ncbi:MAG: hypothetical protein J1D87_09725 [Lachnospiraceae bacterium]|nr:hypothetical protein [Lachnospiraceae bacterium]
MKTSRQNDKNLTRLLVQIIMLLIISAVSLTGCNNTTDNETLSETVEVDLRQANEPVEFIDSEVTATDNFMEDKNVSMQPYQTAIPCSSPILTIETSVREHFCDGEILNIRYDEISISGDGFEAVAQAVSKWNKQDIEQIEKLKDYVGYTNELSSIVDCNRIDNSVISFKQRWHEYDGFTYYRGINFDVISGKKLLLADILVDEEGFNKKAIEIAVERLQKIPDADKLPSGYEDDVAYDFTNGILDSKNKWYLDAYGIVYSYSNFEDTIWHGYIPNYHEDIPEADDERTVVNSYLPGNIAVTIPYEDVAEYIKPAYCGIQNVGAAKFSVNETVHVNLSNKRVYGKTSYEKSSDAELIALDTILITIDETGSEENIINKISITINNRKETFETEAWMRDAYLLCQENGSTYLLFDTTFADHDDTTYLYDITNGGITKNEELRFARIIKPINANSFVLQEYMTVFGTYFCYATYMIDESTGKLLYPEMYYTDAEYNNITITLIRELPVVIYGEETTLPPGTPLQVTALNNSSGTAYFYELNDGLEGEFYYTIDDWTIRIDGFEESFYFDLKYGG